MAGGRGERLRPLTDTLPKPCVPIGDKIAMDGALNMLRGINIKSATVTVRYKYEAIINHFYGTGAGGHCDGDACAIAFDGAAAETEVVTPSLDFFIEEEPLGTAGSVKAAITTPQKRKFDALVVLSGDTVCDFDLSAAAEHHFESGADATLVLAHSDEPWLYGVVDIEGGSDTGRITGFIEKPARYNGSAVINTGIYLLSPRAVAMIPEREYDFGRELFPAMLRSGYTLHGITLPGYWCDIGTPAAYRRACFDAAGGKIGGYTATVNEFGAVAGRHCRIGRGGTAEGCVLHDGVTAGRDFHATDAIFCRGVTLGDGVSVGAGAVIGADSVIGDGVSIPCDAKIEPGTRCLYNKSETDGVIYELRG